MNQPMQPKHADDTVHTAGLNCRVFSPAAVLGTVIVSLIYFADIFIRSSHKLFWYDELFTVYLCQLPTFKATWIAVKHGADFNPPLFYLLTRISQSLFGHGMIATRLPATIGVWVFGLSIFVFVSRRVGTVAGAVAGILPFFTLAQFYAYEARPTGLTVGFCGLAIVCWQKSFEGRFKLLWTLAFSLGLLGAALSHVYAIYAFAPFGAVEVYSIIRTRRLNLVMALAILLPALIAIPVYLPMLRAYRTLFGTISGLPATPVAALQSFLLTLMGPAVAIALIALICSNLQQYGSAPPFQKMSAHRDRDLVLAIALACLPLLGIAGVLVTRGLFFDRYFLVSAAGWAILLGFAMVGMSARSWIPGALAASMCFLLLADCAVAARHAIKRSNFALVEPSSKLLFSPRGEPMQRHGALVNPPRNEDILLLREIDFLYLLLYAPPEVAAHVYDGALENNDLNLKAYRQLSIETHLDFKTATIDSFVRGRNRFLVYGSNGGPFQPLCGDCIDAIQKAGFLLTAETMDADGILYSYEKSNAAK